MTLYLCKVMWNEKYIWMTAIQLLIFVFIFTAVFFFISAVYEKKLIRRRLRALHNNFELYEAHRREREKEIQSLYGAAQKRDIFSHLEKNLKYSGLGGDDYGVSMEKYIIFLMVGGVLAYAAGSAITLSVGVMAMIMFYISGEGFMMYIRKKRYVKTEAVLLAFINSVEAYSASVSDIVTVLDLAKESVEGFLKRDIERAVDSARKKGNSSEAFIQLEECVEHPFFKTFIRNLEAASRTTADYGMIVQGSREMLAAYINNSRIRENIHKDSLFRLGLLCAGGMLCAYMSAELILGMSLRSLFYDMYASVAGRCILAYIMGGMGYVMYTAIRISDSKGE